MNRTWILASLIFPISIKLGSAAPAVTETAAAPRVFLLEAKELRATKQRFVEGDKSLAPAMAQLEREAREALGAGPFSVVNKKAIPPSGDKHDYMSQAPYFWPNPATSNGLPYIRRDGERNPGAYRDSDRRSIGEMADKIETLALAYYFKGDENYAVKAAALTRAWFLDPATRMNPNFNYGQAVLGVNDGRAAGLIESRMFTRVVDAIGLLAGSKAWTEADQRGLREWFSKYLDWLQQSTIGRGEAAAKNNHGTYYDIQAVSFALFIGRDELATEILKAAQRKRVAAQIEPDGRQPLELARTKAWSYSVANLGGLMSLATLGERVGVDLWNYQTEDGRSIRRALDFLLPFSLEKRKWPYQQLGGFSREALYPLLRRAAAAYPGSKYQTLLSKIPPVEASNRINLLRPRMQDR
ncbi:MAG: hypothetical protein QOJ40_3128 [Verrucomicrobiota bacterium]